VFVVGFGSPLMVLVMVTCQRPVFTLSGSRVAARRATPDKRIAVSRTVFRISTSLKFWNYSLLAAREEKGFKSAAIISFERPPPPEKHF
jgi:hypothetical protein